MSENQSSPSDDLTPLLRDWPFEPGKINVRLIEGDDGEPRIQIRLDLGVLQMHAEGRPDGHRPDGYSSLLEQFEARLDDHEAGVALYLPDDEPEDSEGDAVEGEEIDKPGPDDASAEGDAVVDPTEMDDRPAFQLTPDDCRQLREEALQYYHRYVALLVLEDYEGVARDTSRNLRLLDFCAKYARAENDREALEQFRSYITMMRTRALASQALKDDEPKAAIVAIDYGINTLRTQFEEDGKAEAAENSPELQMLREMREALVPKLPVSQKSELRQRLQEALARENYELAAILRDELRLMGE